jgi:hypothetical protein
VGAFLKEEKVEQEELGGPEAPSSEDHNFLLDQGKLGCI